MGNAIVPKQMTPSTVNALRPKHRLRGHPKPKPKARPFAELVDSLPSIADADPDPLKNIQAFETYPTLAALWDDYSTTLPHMKHVTGVGYHNLKHAVIFGVSQAMTMIAVHAGIDGDDSIFDRMSKELEAFNEELNAYARKHMELDYEHMPAPLREFEPRVWPRQGAGCSHQARHARC